MRNSTMRHNVRAVLRVRLRASPQVSFPLNITARATSAALSSAALPQMFESWVLYLVAFLALFRLLTASAAPAQFPDRRALLGGCRCACLQTLGAVTKSCLKAYDVTNAGSRTEESSRLLSELHFTIDFEALLRRSAPPCFCDLYNTLTCGNCHADA